MLMRTSLPPPSTALPDCVRARGAVRVVIGATPRGSAPLVIAESAGYRVRFPRVGGGCEGVLINTGGGLAGGDRMEVDVVLGREAAATLTTQAAEKVYRAEGAGTEIAVSLDLQAGSRLDWLPQEQILFSGARLARTLDAAMARDASLTLVESAVFGRVAMGEAMETGAFADRWRIRRDDRLIFAEEIRLAGPVSRMLQRRAVANGARAIATCLHIAPEAEARRDDARAAIEGAACECGISAQNGMLIARFLSPDPQALRADLVHYLAWLRGRPVPRSWQS